MVARNFITVPGEAFNASGAGAVERTVDDKLRDVVSVKDFGAVGDGVEDDTAAIQAALNSGAKTVYAPAGTFKLTASVTIPADVSLVGEGRNVTAFTAAGNTTSTFSAQSVLTKIGSAPTQIADLNATATKGTNSLTFASAHGLAVGDVILIYNPTDSSFSGSRTYYRAGEFCTVAEITSATAVVLEGYLFDTYLSANVDVYKCSDFCSGSLRGFNVIAPGPGANGIVRALTVTYGHKIELDDIGVDGSDNTSMSIQRSYKVTGRSLDCRQWSQSPGFGTQYGLAVSNCQEVDLSGTFIGWRHGITFGGGQDFAVPCRACNVHDFTAKSKTGDITSADWHGNCEWCVYENGIIYGGGLNIAGNNNRITGIKAIGDDMILVYGREILGCDHIVENIECYTRRNDVTRGLIDVGGNSNPMTSTNTKYGGRYIFRNIQIDAPLNTRHGVVVRNGGFVGDPFDVIVDNFTYIAPNSNNASFAAVFVSTISGDKASRVQATGVTTLLSTVTPSLAVADSTTLVRQDPQTGSVSFTTNTGVNFIDNFVTFAKRFARVPSVTVNSQFENTNADRVMALARDLAIDDFRLRVRRMDDLGNFTGAQTFNVNWTATVCEW